MNLVWWFRYLDTHARCWVKTSPHVMIVGAAKDMMQDHPRDSKPDSTKPYLMWPDRCDWPLARAAQRKPPRRIQLLLVMRLFSSRSFVIPLVKAHMTITGTPNWALTVKTTVPTPCTPPFPEILSNRVPGVSRPAARELIRFPRECLSGG